MEAEIKRQVDILTAGASEVLPAAGLRAKIAKSLKEKKPLRVKLGVDPTAPDLHLGHAVPLRKLRQFQDLGHKAILIIGDFTAMVGDPSGRSATRPKLTHDQVEANAKTYTDQAFKILDNSDDRLELRYNSRWLAAMDFASILALTGRFTVAGLLVRDDFMKRYEAEQSIGLHEFLYPVMQAYDSVEIEADIELGGTDQRFNLLAGRELQEKMELEPQTAITLPLLEGTDGVKKMSKSYDNHIGLTFAPADMLGKVMSIPDEAPGSSRFSLIVKYYQLALGRLPAEVNQVETRLESEELGPRDAKRELAKEIVATYHGPEKAERALIDFDRRFGAAEKVKVTDDAWLDLAEDFQVPTELINAEGAVWLPKLLAGAGAAPSTSEARRLIDQGGVRVDGTQVKDVNTDISGPDPSRLEVGKRKKIQILWPSGDGSA